MDLVAPTPSMLSASPVLKLSNGFLERSKNKSSQPSLYQDEAPSKLIDEVDEVDLQADALEDEEFQEPPPQPTEVIDQLERSQMRINIDEDEEPFVEEEILDTEKQLELVEKAKAVQPVESPIKQYKG